jgi:hypothetical protein
LHQLLTAGGRPTVVTKLRDRGLDARGWGAVGHRQRQGAGRPPPPHLGPPLRAAGFEPGSHEVLALFDPDYDLDTTYSVTKPSGSTPVQPERLPRAPRLVRDGGGCVEVMEKKDFDQSGNRSTGGLA